VKTFNATVQQNRKSGLQISRNTVVEIRKALTATTTYFRVRMIKPVVG